MKRNFKVLSAAIALVLCAMFTNVATAADHREAPAISKAPMAAMQANRAPTNPGGTRYDCTYGESKVDKCNCNSVVDCINLSKANHCKGEIKDLGGGKGECTAKSSARPKPQAPAKLKANSGGGNAYECDSQKGTCSCDGILDCLDLQASGKCKGDVSENPNDDGQGSCKWDN